MGCNALQIEEGFYQTPEGHRPFTVESIVKCFRVQGRGLSDTSETGLEEAGSVLSGAVPAGEVGDG